MSATPKASPTSHSYFSQRLRLHYLDWGNASAPPLLLIHGTRDHCHNWDWVAQAMREDFHIVAPDLRGHGDSQWATGSTYGSFEYVYDIAQLVHQGEFEGINIIAHSLGGTIALKFAGVFPELVRRLIVIEGAGGGWGETNEPAHIRLRSWIDRTRGLSSRLPRRYESLEAAYERMHNANDHLTQEQARHLTLHGSDQNEDGTYTWKFDNYTHAGTPNDMSYEDSKSLWGNITCPVLIVGGSESWAKRGRVDEVLPYFKDATSVTIDGAGHWVHHDQLDEFLRITRQFLR